VIAAHVASTMKSNASRRRSLHAGRWVTIVGLALGAALLFWHPDARALDQDAGEPGDVTDAATTPALAVAASASMQADVSYDLATGEGTTVPNRRAFQPQLAVTTSPVPTLDAADGSPRRVRVDLTGWTHSPEVAGLGLSIQSSVVQPSHVLIPLAPGAASSDTDLAVRWRSAPWSGNRRVDVAAWRRVTPDAAELARFDSQAVYGARVEMQFSSIRASRRLMPELGAIGFQFDGGAKLSLRAKRGKPMLYFRSSF
jgi:hypothetical protein